MGCQIGKTNQIQIRSKYNNLIGIKFQEAIESSNPQLKYLQNKWNQFEIKDFTAALKFKQSDPTRFRKYLMNGALSSNRWPLWKVSLFVDNIFESGCYEALLKSSQNQFDSDIEKDLPRTLPGHQEFHKKSQALQNVLKAIAVYNNDYVTGMNQVAGFLLLVCGMEEEEAFWMLNYLNINPQFKFHQLYQTSDSQNQRNQFEFVEKLLNIFHKHFKNQMPQLYQHFEAQDITQYCYIWKWIFSLFLQTFPFEVVLYFFDFMIANNILAIISLSLALLKHFQSHLLKLDQYQIAQFITQLSECQDVFDKSKHSNHLCVEQIIIYASQFQEQLGFSRLEETLQ
ncbi:unnamed protein product [Paramecium primaurelia]|uniref:Rab-GAP TBC domain-containing protein n=1 Tax=Paramecium primaurelia TaxID=5886 RepID=A0A8S1NZ38_PARPR|nr:unnamed protein product [Paramecium primaurelia]